MQKKKKRGNYIIKNAPADPHDCVEVHKFLKYQIIWPFYDKEMLAQVVKCHTVPQNLNDINEWIILDIWRKKTTLF